MVDLNTVLQQALDIADHLITLGVSQQQTQHTKGDKDFALDVDFSVEKALKQHLTTHTNIPVLGEELGWQNTQSSHYWVIDPLDGTINYAHQLPLCGVCIALIDENQAILAGISLPFLHERYLAMHGQGATCNGQPVRCANTQKLNQALVSLGDFAVGTDAATRNQTRLTLLTTLVPQVQRIRMLGSAAVQFAWLASGKVDISIVLSNKPWDVQAGVLIAREAGAVVFDADGSEHSTESRYTLACTAALKDTVINIMQKL